MGFLSDRGLITSAQFDESTGRVHIIVPDAGQPTGFASYQITVAELNKYLQDQVTSNLNAITALQAAVSALGDVAVSKLTNATGDRSVELPENSVLEKVIYRPRSTSNVTITCGWSFGSSDIIYSKTVSAYPPDGNDPTEGSICIAKTLVFRSSNSLKFRITGGNADITVLYRKNIFN